MTEDCRNCKDWRTCLGKEYGFLFAELRWCPWQVCWILANADVLHAGRWPMRYSPFEEPKTNRLNQEGNFVKPAIIIAEVEKRLETCGTAGESLVYQCKAGETLETLSDAAWEVLMYLKGWRRKKMTFSQWCYWQNKKRKSSKKLELVEMK